MTRHTGSSGRSKVAVLLTLVGPGVVILRAINERVAKVYEELRRHMPRTLYPALAVRVIDWRKTR